MVQECSVPMDRADTDFLPLLVLLFISNPVPQAVLLRKDWKWLVCSGISISRKQSLGMDLGRWVLTATVNNSGEGLYLFYILGKVGVVRRQHIEHQLRSQWKIPLPRANEWVFFGWVFVDFKNL